MTNGRPLHRHPRQDRGSNSSRPASLSGGADPGRTSRPRRQRATHSYARRAVERGPRPANRHSRVDLDLYLSFMARPVSSPWASTAGTGRPTSSSSRGRFVYCMSLLDRRDCVSARCAIARVVRGGNHGPDTDETTNDYCVSWGSCARHAFPGNACCPCEQAVRVGKTRSGHPRARSGRDRVSAPGQRRRDGHRDELRARDIHDRSPRSGLRTSRRRPRSPAN